MKLTVGGQNPGMILEIYTGGIVNSLNREGRNRRKPWTRVHNSASNVSMAHYFENPSDKIAFGLFIYYFLYLLKVHDSGKNAGRYRTPYLPTQAIHRFWRHERRGGRGLVLTWPPPSNITQ